METFPDDFLPRGLLNHGNTCYMNASLQALFAIPAFRQYFFNCYFRRVRQQCNSNILDHLERFFLQRLQPQSYDGETISKTISFPLVSSMCQDLKLRFGQQQDAQEFLKYLFTHIHEELQYIDTRLDNNNADIRTSRLLHREAQQLIQMKQKAHPKYSEHLHKFYTLAMKTEITNADYSKLDPVRPPLKFRSIISDIFSGKLKNTVHCLKCKNSSSRLETFQDLSIPISILVKPNSSSNSSSQSLCFFFMFLLIFTKF